jgi:MFS family permease
MGSASPLRRFASASGAGNLADGVFAVALPLLALTLTSSPAAIAAVTVAGRLPWLTFALFAGLLADRLDRRRIMIAVSSARTVVVGALAALVIVDRLSLPAIYAAAALLGIAETMFDTAAQSILPMIVEPHRLSTANGRLSGIEVVAQRFVGPPLGGFLAALTLSGALALTSVAHAVAAVTLLTLAGTFRVTRTSRSPSPVLSDIRVGINYLWSHRLLRRLALLVGAVSIASNAANAIFVLYAVNPGPMGLTKSQYGLILTTVAAGAVAASLTSDRIERAIGPARCLRLAIVASACCTAAPLLVNPLAVAPWWLMGGYFITTWNAITVSLRQQLVPADLLGRTNSVYRLLAWGGGPLGATAGGITAELIGTRPVFAIAGAATLALLLAMRPLTDDALAPPNVEAVPTSSK